MKGNIGNILRVDLGKGKFEVEHPTEEFYRKYIGGACMGAYYLLKEMAPKTDPFAPESVMVFSTSSVVGAPISGNSRHCVTAKSPQTGGLASSEAGGYWGPELRFAGFDAIVIKGKSPKPVYLWIKDGICELRDAAAVWGLTTGEAQDGIREELGEKKARLAIIGPSGEKLCRYAAIANELKHFNGRSGLGAVMGSKNLKAIVVRGTAKPEFHDLPFISALAKTGIKRVEEREGSRAWRTYGTNLNVGWNSAIGGLPTKNWTMGNFAGEDLISAEAYYEKMMDKPGTCWACFQTCKRDIKDIETPYKIESRYGGPEYESLGMLGPNCMVSDLNAISKANEIASAYGMDTISLGGVIGFVMECYEKGIVTKADLGGVEARFGDGKALIALAEMTAKREGFGDRMAEGTARLARSLGPAAERLCVTVKGKEFPAHMPTAKGVMALIYAVNSFGPDHVSTAHDGDIAAPSEAIKGFGLYDAEPDPGAFNFDKVKLTAYSQRYVSAIDTFSVCQFCFHTWSIFDMEDLLAVVDAATGWRYTMFELMLLGERRINMAKIFNVREGFTAEDDMLPPRLFEDPLEGEGIGAGRKIDKAGFLERREEYYVMNGWDPRTGMPGKVKLRELGLGWLVRE
ncbi:MAG: hypothetical protein A2Z99_07195 [Treponema sp. GWB1_62_6]|nr:MAG: hypothetical protein A2Z99_07195 [Treponema sp. GWB1_62_6]OHE64331.1 MAG: hypothetical protein A2001_11070 [Treponema sp. GWC1_61_84]OHE68191.1 MAG: hypothetical protein A2413_01535 [Treponema sp. RIFOXYC1_FULL_61_9]HCM27163.1 aldehyde ferredoxin oxidoreductase [Treponema sp.]